MKLKHIPVYLRRRTLEERLEKGDRIREEEKEHIDDTERKERWRRGMQEGEHAADDEELLGSSSAKARKTLDEHEEVKLSDLLELVMELVDMVEIQMDREGTLQDARRFRETTNLLRRGRDAAWRGSRAHVDDKRALLMAFTAFSEHYTNMLRTHRKLTKRNEELKALAYETMEVAKKNEQNFDRYRNQIQSVKSAQKDQAHEDSIEINRLKNAYHNMKLELQLKNNELKEARQEAQILQQQLEEERMRHEELRRDKDGRIHSLLAQLQSYSFELDHAKFEREKIEKENERLWNERMAMRATQLRSAALSDADRALAMERDAQDRQQYEERRKAAAKRDVEERERLRQLQQEQLRAERRREEMDALNELERMKKELEERKKQMKEDAASSSSSGPAAAATAKSGSSIQEEERAIDERMKQLKESQRAFEQGDDAAAAADEQRAVASSVAQRRRGYPEATELPPELPISDPIRAGSYSGGVATSLHNSRESPALPLFTGARGAGATTTATSSSSLVRHPWNYTSGNTDPAAAAYQPSSVASSIPPPNPPYMEHDEAIEAGLREARRIRQQAMGAYHPTGREEREASELARRSAVEDEDAADREVRRSHVAAAASSSSFPYEASESKYSYPSYPSQHIEREHEATRSEKRERRARREAQRAKKEQAMSDEEEEEQQWDHGRRRTRSKPGRHRR